jgi:DNA-binding transcriptional MerR regulator
MGSLRSISARYTISQVSRLFGVTPRALRFYEQIGLVAPDRDGVNRLYSRGDCQRIQMIAIARKAGLTLEHIRELLDLYDPADSGEAQIRKTVDRLRERIADLDAQREFAAQKISELKLKLRGASIERPVFAKVANAGSVQSSQP